MVSRGCIAGADRWRRTEGGERERERRVRVLRARYDVVFFNITAVSVFYVYFAVVMSVAVSCTILH